jgi:uncharacterized protein YndB with AHSA1/START domain
MNAGTTASVKHQVFIKAPIDAVFDLVSTARGWNQWATTDCVLEMRPGGRFIPEWRSPGIDGGSRRDEGRVLNLDGPRHIAFERTLAGGVRTRFTLDLRPETSGTTVRFADHGFPVTTPAEVNVYGNFACNWGEALALLRFVAEAAQRPAPVAELVRAPAPVEIPRAEEPAAKSAVTAKRKRSKESRG